MLDDDERGSIAPVIHARLISYFRFRPSRLTFYEFTINRARPPSKSYRLAKRNASLRMIVAAGYVRRSVRDYVVSVISAFRCNSTRFLVFVSIGADSDGRDVVPCNSRGGVGIANVSANSTISFTVMFRSPSAVHFRARWARGDFRS